WASSSSGCRPYAGNSPGAAAQASRSLGQVAASIAGTTCRETPAAHARATTSARSASNAGSSRWTWVSTSGTSVAVHHLAVDHAAVGRLSRRVAMLPVGQQQGAEAEQDLVDERQRIRDQHADGEQDDRDLEQRGIAQAAREGEQRGEQGTGHAGKRREGGVKET